MERREASERVREPDAMSTKICADRRSIPPPWRKGKQDDGDRRRK
jgi:hypothetical protein